MKRRDLLLALSGLALFAYVMSKVGFGVVAQLHSVLAGLALVLALGFARLALQTMAWQHALEADGSKYSTVRLMGIRLASQGIGYLTVLGPVASEPMKIGLLSNRPNSTAATLVDTGVYWFASGLVAIAGCFAAAVQLSHSTHAMRPAMAMAVVFGAVLLVLARPRRRIAPVIGMLGARTPAWLRKADQIEFAIREFANEHPACVRRMFLLDLLCQVLVAGELVAILSCLKLSFDPSSVLGLEAGTRLVKIAAGWMPARIGADESGAAASFVLFGLPAAAGLALALVRRTRDLAASLIGFAWLAWQSRTPGHASIAVLREREITCKL